ncbi:MAG: hypothetical protein M1268_00655 [Patescibacteria group bacterium]|nr:hypothetical protein [Patescibacteria group bacterium]
MQKTELYLHHPENEGPQEKCGITAILSKSGTDVSFLIPEMQKRLHHRGRDSAGMAGFNQATGEIVVYKDLGSTFEVFPDGFDFTGRKLCTDRAIGHNRYGTSGGNEKDNADGAQPIITEWRGRSIAIAYNGNLPESEREKLRRRIPPEMQKAPDFDTVDIAQAIVSAEGDTWEEKIKKGLDGIYFAYALNILTGDGDVFGLRGPTGTWPLWAGESDDLIMFASEDRVARNSDIIKWSEVKPGELVKATSDGVEKKQIFTSPGLFRCVLHDAYGAKGDSRIRENVTYNEFRRQLGINLARIHPIEADLYVGIPETGLVIAEGYAGELGKDAMPLITTNGVRSFIGKNGSEIKGVISGKYKIADTEKVLGKDVMVLDDSLIRGNTSPIVVKLLKEAGARKIHLGLILPKFIRGCDGGYYIRNDQLIAVVKKEDGVYIELSEAEIAAKVGVDSVHFLTIGGLEDAYESVFGEKDVMCLSCVSRQHPLDKISDVNKKEEPVLVYSA